MCERHKVKKDSIKIFRFSTNKAKTILNAKLIKKKKKDKKKVLQDP